MCNDIFDFLVGDVVEHFVEGFDEVYTAMTVCDDLFVGFEEDVEI